MDGRGVQMKHALLIEYLSLFRHLEASQDLYLSPVVLFFAAILSCDSLSPRVPHTDSVPREYV